MPGVDDATTWKVAELATHLGRLLGGAFPDDLWVEGQIRDLKRAPNGHVYFQLAEPSAAGRAPDAQLAVVLLEAEKRLVNALLRRAGGAVRMEDGIEVRVRGRIRWWAPRGVVQLRMSSIDPDFTLGRLAADRERTRAALAADGLLEANRRHPLPPVPLRVGLVTSRDSAAHADVLAQLGASGYAFEVVDVDARTQGPGAEPSIRAALGLLARRAEAGRLDVVALVRGGGARTDLAAFDGEGLARAIAAMPVPVLTGIGHEIDRSIADEVAHTACKTPTAVAVALTDQVGRFLARTAEQAERAGRAGHRRLAGASTRVDGHERRLGRAGSVALVRQRQRLDALPARLARSTTRRLAAEDERVARQADQLRVRAARALDRAARDLDRWEAAASVHDPARALARGWSITRGPDGRVVRSVADLAPGDALAIEVADGTVAAEVTGTDQAGTP